jgi:hypothetical protein
MSGRELIQVRRAVPDDAKALAPRLRAADVQEIKAAIGDPPEAVLERSIEWSEPCFAAVKDAETVIALFGAVPELNDHEIGIVWLLGSDELANHPFYFLRNSRKWVDELQGLYPVLWNCVDARNETHIKWLKWCDFTFLKRIEEYGVERRPFYEFTRVRAENISRTRDADELTGKQTQSSLVINTL